MILPYLDVVGNRVLVAVRIVGIGADDLLFSVGDGIAIGVSRIVVQRVEGVGAVHQHLGTVGDPAVVGVFVVGIGFLAVLGPVLVLVLVAVPQAVIVRVLGQGIGVRLRIGIPCNSGFQTVAQFVTVGVGVEGVGFSLQFVPAAILVQVLFAVLEAVPIGIRFVGIGLGAGAQVLTRPYLQPIREAIVVSVRIQRIRTQKIVLHAVAEPVAVGIGDCGIGAHRPLVAVSQVVAVGVVQKGAGFHEGLP